MTYLTRCAAWLRLSYSAASLVLLTTGAVVADKISDASGDISIIDAAAEPAARGTYTNIHVQLENSGSKSVTLRSVETKLSEQGAFDIHAGPGSTLHQSAFTLGAGEQARFANGSFRLTLGPLRRDLKEGDVVEVTFTFDTWSTAVPVHVHEVSP